MTPSEGLKALALLGMVGSVSIGGGFLRFPEAPAAALVQIEAPPAKLVRDKAPPKAAVWRTTGPAVGCRNTFGFDAMNLAKRGDPDTVIAILQSGACAVSQADMAWDLGAPTGSPYLVSLCRDDAVRPGGCYLFWSDAVDGPGYKPPLPPGSDGGPGILR